MLDGYTTANILKILEESGEISAVQVDEIRQLELSQRRFLAEQTGQSEPEISPVEVIASVAGEREDIGHLTEDKILARVAQSCGLEHVKLDPIKLDAAFVSQTVSRPFARKNLVVPLCRTASGIKVAVHNPFDLEVVESLRHFTGSEIIPCVAAKSDIIRIIAEFYGFHRSVQGAAKAVEPFVDIGNLEQFVRLKNVKDIEANEQHIVNAVEYLLRYAFDQRASDIHIEPRRNHSQVRLRIDGVLHDIYSFPREVHLGIASRIKMLARIDISEKRRPQDGRIKTAHGDSEEEIRVSTLPTAFGEKLVLRVFDPKIYRKVLTEIGMTSDQLNTYQQMLLQKHGLILITGPTGSGKTTTLYSALLSLANSEVNISTVEDPIEMVFDDFNQTAVDRKIDLTFASTLRTILRQDPDIIMIGEIRDPETAAMALQAALTGHLVLSTLHTNDTAGAIDRLLDLGAERYLIASTLLGVIAQRLVRTICNECVQRTPPSQGEIRALGLPNLNAAHVIQRGKGCPRCRQTGLWGRHGVYEVFSVEEKMREKIAIGDHAESLKQFAISQGMHTLKQSAIELFLAGKTTSDEVVRVISDRE